MDQSELRERFPRMRPIRQTPTLIRFNGCGTSMHGRRDYDPETRTYVKTQTLCLFFIPLFSLAAYRVQDAGRGRWYFIGREPLSDRAFRLNFIVAFVLVGFACAFAAGVRSRSPAGQAARLADEADEMAERGEIVDAARRYRGALLTSYDSADRVRDGLRRLLDGPVRECGASEAAAVLTVVRELQERNRPVRVVDDLVPRTLALAQHHEASDPRGALRLLEVVAGLDPAPERRRAALERLVVLEPQDLDAVGALAVILEAAGERARCRSLLEPRRDSLGQTEGARILGQIYAAEGRADVALPLLEAYTRDRLARLHEAQQRYDATVQRVWDEGLARLQRGSGPAFFYQRYDRASDEEKEQLVQEYLAARLRESPDLRKELEQVRRAAEVVPAGIDLAIMRLRRAQDLPQGAERRRELEAAEATFLSLGGVAGETDEYRLFLGQVYYWLGRPEEGKALHDALLAAHERAPAMLYQVASVLRGVGDHGAARALLEEAWEAAPAGPDRDAIAAMRAASPIEEEDELAWLERAGTSMATVRARRGAVEGARALAQGRVKEAEDLLRAAIAAYDELPETSQSANDSALACFTLYGATGDMQAFTQGVARMERAVALDPAGSISAHNAAQVLLEQAVLDTSREAVDLPRLRWRVGTDLLSYLHANEAERAAVVSRLRGQPALARARRLFEQVIVLAPRNVTVLAGLAELHVLTDDEQALRELAGRLADGKATFDTGAQQAEVLAYYAGARDEKWIEEMQATVARLRPLVRELSGRPDRTYAAAASALAGALLGLANVGGEVDTGQVVALATRAAEAAPSSGTAQGLISALDARALDALAREDAAFEADRKRLRRALSGVQLLAWILDHDGPLRERALALPDVQRALVLEARDVAAYPSLASARQAVLLRAVASDAAEAARQGAGGNEIARLRSRMNLILAPYVASTVLEEYWWRRLEGDEEGARALLAEGRARNLPLPRD